jgi:oligopeptide/dipeptide ABC transporter ATP-binding protein
VTGPEPLLEVRSLCIECDDPLGKIIPLDDLSFELEPGDIVGLVGESGSGKTTVLRGLTGQLDSNCRVVGGSVTFRGQEVLTPKTSHLDRIRGKEVGVVFQNAMTSLNPVLKVKTQINEVLRAHDAVPREQRPQWMRSQLAQLGFRDPDRVLDSYPHQLSGGMAQRVAIAVATCCRPGVLLADECTTALDVTVQAEVVRLMRDLADQQGTALLFITHDLALVTELCTRVLVLYGGKVVESGRVKQVMQAPRHPYTRALLDAVPLLAQRRRLIGIAGLPPVVREGFAGCRFAERCERAAAECRVASIPWTSIEPGHGHLCLHPLEYGVRPVD